MQLFLTFLRVGNKPISPDESSLNYECVCAQIGFDLRPDFGSSEISCLKGLNGEMSFSWARFCFFG